MFAVAGTVPVQDFPLVAGEVFLEDEEAPHPFYTRGFILHEEDRIHELIARAYKHNNAARCLLVKGKQDCVADRQGIQATIDSPVEAAMGAIGGTGDTLTGIVTALIESGGDFEGLYRCCKSRSPGRVLCPADSGNPGDGNHSANTESA